LNVHPATAADIPALLDIERQCHTAAHWSRQQYEDLFRAGENLPHRLVLVVDEQSSRRRHGSESAKSESPPSPIVGFLVANQISPDWELENIVIAPASRRRGLATQLLTTLLTRACETNSESVFLEVRESNHAARALYARLEFEQNGRRQFYYANPAEDAILYRVALNKLSLNRPSL
jgi:ribosomal-protein-alanine acetyltransferase